MSNTDHTDPSALLRILRADVEAMPGAVAARLGERLAPAALAATAGVNAAATPAAKPPWGNTWRGVVVGLALPASALLGAMGHAWLKPALHPQPPLPQITPAASHVAESPRVPAAQVSSPPSEGASPPPSAALQRTTTVVRGARGLSEAVRPPVTAGLEDDLPLLERARSQLTEGNPGVTLQLLRVHERRYPNSPLAQEREALAVRALVAAGSRDEAQRRAQQFVARYPQSLLRASVERTIGKIP